MFVVGNVLVKPSTVLPAHNCDGRTWLIWTPGNRYGVAQSSPPINSDKIRKDRRADSAEKTQWHSRSLATFWQYSDTQHAGIQRHDTEHSKDVGLENRNWDVRATHTLANWMWYFNVRRHAVMQYDRPDSSLFSSRRHVLVFMPSFLSGRAYFPY